MPLVTALMASARLNKHKDFTARDVQICLITLMVDYLGAYHIWGRRISRCGLHTPQLSPIATTKTTLTLALALQHLRQQH